MIHSPLWERIKSLHARLISSPIILSFDVLSEQVIEGIGLYRIRIHLNNGDVVQLFERFELIAGKMRIDKYSFHWQRANSTLIRRWDNAPHHSEITTFPHHLHESNENNILPHNAVDCFAVLQMIESNLIKE